MKNNILIEGCRNFRDLGGHKNLEGKTVNYGRFYRGDTLAKLTDKDIDLLMSNRIYTIIDLRSVEERRESPDIVEGMDEFIYKHIPLIDGIHSKNSTPDNIHTLPELYRSLIDDSWMQIAKVFQVMMERERDGIIFHCTAGKDRTGVVAAMLLLLANIPEPKIIEDYSISSKNMYGNIHRKNLFKEMNVPIHFLLSEPEYMEDFIAHLKEKYGGAENYLRNVCDFSKGDILQLRQQLIS